MTEQQIILLMGSGRSEDEWNANASRVKTEFGGYPSFWYSAIVLSGLMNQVQKGWK